MQRDLTAVLRGSPMFAIRLGILLAIVTWIGGAAGGCTAAEPVRLVVDAPIPPSAALAVEGLERVLKQRGAQPRRRINEQGNSIIFGVAGASAAVDRVIQSDH